MENKDLFYMELALAQALEAAKLGEVPVGAIICRNGEIISTAFNRRETDKNALAHAELLAISAACETLGGWRLHESELYVTLEPCPMCMGAIINSRIRRVIYGARDPKAGCAESVINLPALPFNHRPELTGGIMEESCASILREFFAELRKN